MDDQGVDLEGSEIIAPTRTRPRHINSPLARRALIGFGVGFAIMLAAVFIPTNLRWLLLIVVLPAFFLMVASTVVFTGAIFFS